MLFDEFPRPWAIVLNGHSVYIRASNGRKLFSISDLNGESLVLLPEWAMVEIVDFVNALEG